MHQTKKSIVMIALSLMICIGFVLLNGCFTTSKIDELNLSTSELKQLDSKIKSLLYDAGYQHVSSNSNYLVEADYSSYNREGDNVSISVKSYYIDNTKLDSTSSKYSNNSTYQSMSSVAKAAYSASLSKVYIQQITIKAKYNPETEQLENTRYYSKSI